MYNYKTVLISSFCSVVTTSSGSAVVVVIVTVSATLYNVLEKISSEDAVVDGSVVVLTRFTVGQKLLNTSIIIIVISLRSNISFTR